MNDIVSAFSAAASELGFRFEPHFIVNLAGGISIRSLGLARQFGGAVGALVFSTDCEPTPDNARTLREMGYFCSVLWPAYGEYNPKLFKATLDDWQFFGAPTERPAWYTGKPWS